MIRRRNKVAIFAVWTDWHLGQAYIIIGQVSSVGFSRSIKCRRSFCLGMSDTKVFHSRIIAQETCVIATSLLLINAHFVDRLEVSPLGGVLIIA
jgi:hypothetical protein